MPEIVRCPACDRETYAGLPACPHCDHAFAAQPKPNDSRERVVPKGRFGYIGAHWRGELSLAVSYWVNGVLVSIIAYPLIFLFMGTLETYAPETHVRTTMLVGLGQLAVIAAIAVWQYVGIWRAATSSRRRTGRAFWPSVAKLMVVLGIIGGVRDIVEIGDDLVQGLRALSEPELADYEVTLLGNTDLIFAGAINDRAVDEVVSELEDPRVAVLRMRSQGGLVDPALRLARHIRTKQVTVMAESECLSACVIVLAASPNATVYPGTTVAFHDIESISNVRSDETKAGVEDQRRELEAFYREMGIAGWVLEETRAKGYWSPTIRQQLEVGLIRYVFDPGSGEFVEAAAYCEGADCD